MVLDEFSESDEARGVRQPGSADDIDALIASAESLPEPMRAQVAGFFERVSKFSGPLPPPSHLREYEEILPGLADRIVTMAESQSHHRMGLEREVITSEQRRSWAGWASGTAIALGLLAAAVWVTLEGHEAVGVIFAGADVAGVAGVLIVGRRADDDARNGD